MTTEKRETVSLIGSDKVEGTNVYRSNGDNIGSIERIMIDKLSGKVAYAVMSFGGFLGIGHDHYPVPWSLLTYNTRLGGFTDAALQRLIFMGSTGLTQQISAFSNTPGSGGPVPTTGQLNVGAWKP